jgi:hypothetical protein
MKKLILLLLLLPNVVMGEDYITKNPKPKVGFPTYEFDNPKINKKLFIIPDNLEEVFPGALETIRQVSGLQLLDVYVNGDKLRVYDGKEAIIYGCAQRCWFYQIVIYINKNGALAFYIAADSPEITNGDFFDASDTILYFSNLKDATKIPSKLAHFSSNSLKKIIDKKSPQVIVNPSQCKTINLPYESNQTIYKINSFTNVGFICEKEGILK